PEVLRYVAGPLQSMTDGRLDASILRQLFIASAMIIIMLVRPRGLWPAPEHGKSLAASRGSPTPIDGSIQQHGSGLEAPSDEVPGGAARPMSINP
ncbi:MAG: ABC transporter ATP-binding protein, partial [Comamonadaceae bacterium]